MVAPLNPSQVLTATKYLKGASDLTMRRRLLLAWLDEEGRINRNATGRDLNWLIHYKNAVAQAYTPYSNLTFTNDLYHAAMTVTPCFWSTTSAMDITENLTNTGETAILSAYLTRYEELAIAMQNLTCKALYLDGNSAAGTNLPTGLGTFARKSASIATTNGDRIAPPVAGTIYGGQPISLGGLGGTWSSNSAVPMNSALGTDWPDGQGDATNAYDALSPRLYNENTSRWADPTASAANSSWRTNCISMLSRANTDLKQNSVESMMPNIHISGSERYQAIKDKLRESFRDIATEKESVNLGYHETISFEGAAITVDYECPSNLTYSLCAASMDYQFYPSVDDGKAVSAIGDTGGQKVTGGIYTAFGPVRHPLGLQWVWIMFAGGQTRFNPRWITVHSDWT